MTGHPLERVGKVVQNMTIVLISCVKETVTRGRASAIVQNLHDVINGWSPIDSNSTLSVTQLQQQTLTRTVFGVTVMGGICSLLSQLTYDT